jgi:hypothetical protein
LTEQIVSLKGVGWRAPGDQATLVERMHALQTAIAIAWLVF